MELFLQFLCKTSTCELGYVHLLGSTGVFGYLKFYAMLCPVDLSSKMKFPYS